MTKIRDNGVKYAEGYGLSDITENYAVRNGETSPGGVTIDDLYKNNPYLDQTVESTIWDEIGLSNKRDKRLADLQQAGAEYNANLLMMEYENEYNSPAAKAQRMKEAGLNPDLLGIEGVSDSAGAAPVSSPEVEGGSQFGDAMENIGQVASFANGVLGAVSMGATIAQQYQSLELGALGLDSAEIDVAQKARQYALGVISDWAPTPEEQQAGSIFDPGEVAKGYFDRPGAQKAFASSLGDLYQSIRTHNESYTEHGKLGASRARAAGSMGSKYYNDPMETLATALAPVYEMEIELWQHEGKFKKDQFRFGSTQYQSEIDYLNGVDHGLRAERTNAENAYGRDEYQFRADFNSTRNKVIRDLKKKADAGNISAMIALMFMSSIGPVTQTANQGASTALQFMKVLK